MTISDLKNRCYGLIEGLYWAGDSNYTQFQREFLDALEDLDKIFEKYISEENK